jgi:hypothetical protein
MLYQPQMAQPAPVKAAPVLPTAALSQTVPQEVIFFVKAVEDSIFCIFIDIFLSYLMSSHHTSLTKTVAVDCAIQRTALIVPALCNDGVNTPHCLPILECTPALVKFFAYL